MEFFKALGVAILTVALTGGFCYWMFFFFKKVFPDARYFLKYKIFRQKYSERDVARLLDYLQANLSADHVFKFLLLNGIDKKRCMELRYIYNQMHQIQLEGGDQHGE